MEDAADMQMPMKMTPRSALLSASMMTPIERAAGRFMRAPDHDAAPGTEAGATPPADAEKLPIETPPADTAPAAGDDGTVLGDAGKGDEPKAEADADGEKKDGEDAAPRGAPEAYDIRPQEGQVFDADAFALVEPLFREAGLSNEMGQKLVDAYAGQILPRIAERYEADQAVAITAARKAWADEARADPEIGGSNWKASIAASAKALDKLGAPEGSPFRTLLNDSGLGNHPEMIRMFVKIGNAVSEDSDFVSAVTAKPKTIEEKFYGSAR